MEKRDQVSWRDDNRKTCREMQKMMDDGGRDKMGKAKGARAWSVESEKTVGTAS